MPTLTTQPQELVTGPVTLYVAPIGTAVPLVDTAPASPWVQVGTNGPNDYDGAGVTVTLNQTLATWTPLGTTAPVAVWRTNEQLEVAVTLADTSPNAFALAMNDVAVTTVAASTGNPGESDVPLLQGPQVSVFACLVRGISALNNTMNAQYAIPAVYQGANPAPVYKLGAPAELALTFMTILDPNGGGFGKLQQQSAART